MNLVADACRHQTCSIGSSMRRPSLAHTMPYGRKPRRRLEVASDACAARVWRAIRARYARAHQLRGWQPPCRGCKVRDHDPCLFVWRMIPIGPQRFCGPLSAVKPHSHGAASCARLRRPGCDAPVRSCAWRARRAAGRVRSRRLAVTCAADKACGY